MKYIHSDQAELRTPAPSYIRERAANMCGLKARILTDAVVAAVVLAILALYAAMFAGLYHWSHYTPLLPPDSASIGYTETLITYSAATAPEWEVHFPEAKCAARAKPCSLPPATVFGL